MRACASCSTPCTQVARGRGRRPADRDSAGYPLRDGSCSFVSPVVWHTDVFPYGQVCQGRTWRISEFLDLYVERILWILSFQEDV